MEDNNKLPEKGKGYNKYKRKGDRNVPRKQSDVSQYTDNLVEYYNKYPTDYDAAFNTPWFKVVGTNLPLSDIIGSQTELTFKDEAKKIPGIMQINYVAGPGVANSALDPVNRTFAMIMADLYAKTSGATLGFNNAQLAMQMASLASIMNCIGEVQRALSATEFWVTKNAYYPRALLNAMGFDYDDVVENKAIAVTRINSVAHAFNNMQIPAFLDVFKRQYTLASNVYLDEESDLGQIYVFKQAGHYEYDFEGFRCTFVRDEKKYSSILRRINDIEAALFRWINNDDFYKVNGALLRAYREAAVETIPDSGLTDVINPKPADHILSQIMNMDIVGQLLTLDITQNVEKNLIYWQPTLSSDPQPPRNYFKTHFLRAFNDNPTKDDNCEMTRLCVTQGVVAYHNVDIDQGTDVTEPRWGITSMQTELVESISIYIPTIGYSGAITPSGIGNNILFIDDTDANKNHKALGAIMSLQPFRYVPPILFVSYTKQTSGNIVTNLVDRTGFVGDLYNYTTLDENVLANQNTVALLSLWRPTLPNLS